MRVFKTRDFARFARKERIGDASLCTAIDRAERGLVDADLGGGVIKQRVPRQGQGRSGGFRTIIAYQFRDRSVFIHGFAKSDQDNISDVDETALKNTAKAMLALDAEAVEALVEASEWKEIDCDA